MAAKFFTGLPLDGPDPECVFGHGEAALRGATAARRRRTTRRSRSVKRACNESPGLMALVRVGRRGPAAGSPASCRSRSTRRSSPAPSAGRPTRTTSTRSPRSASRRTSPAARPSAIAGDDRHGRGPRAAGAALPDRRAGRAPGGRARGRPRGGGARTRRWVWAAFASKPIEEVVAANPKTFAQLYWSGSREAIEARVERARAAGREGPDRHARLDVHPLRATGARRRSRRARPQDDADARARGAGAAALAHALAAGRAPAGARGPERRGRARRSSPPTASGWARRRRPGRTSRGCGGCGTAR